MKQRPGLRTHAAAVVGMAALGIGMLWHAPAPVHAQKLSGLSARLTDLETEAQQLLGQPVNQRKLRSRTYVEERLTDGELYYRLGDYLRASIIFTDLVKNHSSHPAYADAVFLLADSLYRAGDLLGARGYFKRIIDRANEATFRPYVHRSLGRLIEIAIRTQNFEGVDQYFARLSRLPPEEVEAATHYYRAKYLYNEAVPSRRVVQSKQTRDGEVEVEFGAIDQDSLEQARLAFQAVPKDSPYYLQARYFTGVVHILRGQYKQAIDAFHQALRAPVASPEQRRVSELTQLALGRLYYETNQLDQAIEAYQRIPRTSDHFDTALYEVAWTYIRLGDSTRAERALEVLGVAAPDSRYIPDAKLLRANLLLRDGRFDDATHSFRDVVNQFGPVREELEEVIARHEEPRSYFRDLVRQNLEAFDANAFLPQSALKWTSMEGRMDRALSVLSDLSTARQLVKETAQLVERMDAAINAPNVVTVFPGLRLQQERLVALRNRLMKLRQRLIEIETRMVGRAGSPKLKQVRERRRDIEKLLGGVPTEAEDFRVRNEQVLRRYRQLQRELSELEVELQGMSARVVAADRFLHQPGNKVAGEKDKQALLDELENHRDAVEGYRERVRELRVQAEAGQLQVGVGDQRYEQDETLRREYDQLVERERELLREAGVPGAERVDRLFGRVLEVERMLERKQASIREAVKQRTAEMREVLQEETQNLETYRARMGDLEQQTELAVGDVAYANFNQVRDRFYTLVLKADVGKVDVSWARREEHRMRSEMLSRERARAIKALDDEFREIMDDQPAGGKGGE